MKRLVLFSSGFLFAGMIFAQAQTIHDPNASVTITKNEIIDMGQTHNNSNRDVIVLDFEGLGNGDPIDNFYNGGLSGQGFSGANYGIQFSSNAWSLIDTDAGGSGNFANEPSPSTIMYFASAEFPYMNVPSGFTSGFSFYYTSNGSGFVEVYDGLGGTGTLLASESIPANLDIDCTGDPNGSFCHWDAVGVTFDGTAKSVVFGGVSGGTGFDDITFGSSTPGGTVPVSNWALFLGIGLIITFVIYRTWHISRT